jgi:hypothetical protein
MLISCSAVSAPLREIDFSRNRKLVFNPIWQENDIVVMPTEAAHQIVDAAARRLVADLEAAREHTGAWADQPLGYALVESALSRCLARLATTGLWGRDNQIASSVLWQIAGAMLETGWLQLRAHQKPLGYAGDFELLSRIIENRLCDDPLGRLFDRYFQNQAAPSAVRSRTEHAAHALAALNLSRANDKFHVTSVGAGAGIDVQRGLELLPHARRKSVKVTLLDLDEQGLDFAVGRVCQAVAEDQVTAVRENLFRLGRKPKSAELLGEPDLLICSGLFDYLEDEVAGDLLRLFWQRLADGGQMLVGNFVPDHPTRAYMEWIGNWYLQYRSFDDMLRLAEIAEIPASCRTIGADRIGVDLFLTATKP